MSEVFVFCISINGENFCNSIHGIQIHEKNFSPARSLNFFNINSKNAIVELAGEFEDIQRFQGKRIEMFYYNKSFGVFNKVKMIVFKITRSPSKIILDCVSLESLLETKSANLFSLNCRASIGDKKCKLDLSKFKVKGSIENYLHSSKEIIDSKLNIQDTELFRHGKIKINNIVFIVLHITEGKIKILNEIGTQLRKGMEYELTPGCDKALESCQKKYNNAINFQGEPFIFQKFSSSVF